MSRALVITLLGVLGVGASAALWLGVQEARLARVGARHDLAAEELTAATRGWVAVFGCVRHDRAVAVTGEGRVYALGTLFWLLALSREELSFAYPFASLSYILMLIASWQLFRENISGMRLLGTFVICVGVVLTSLSRR